MCSDDRLSIGVYDGCVGMGMCVVWRGISMWGPGGGAHHKFKRGAKFSFEATLNIWCQRKNHVGSKLPKVLLNTLHKWYVFSL